MPRPDKVREFRQAAEEMTIFNRLFRNELNAWLGIDAADFIKSLLDALESVWETAIAPVLIASFGYAATLYAIFYAGATLYETIMEIWDPRYENKPSEVFMIETNSANTLLPKKRSEVKKVIALKNIKY